MNAPSSPSTWRDRPTPHRRMHRRSRHSSRTQQVVSSTNLGRRQGLVTRVARTPSLAWSQRLAADPASVRPAPGLVRPAHAVISLGVRPPRLAHCTSHSVAVAGGDANTACRWPAIRGVDVYRLLASRDRCLGTTAPALLPRRFSGARANAEDAVSATPRRACTNDVRSAARGVGLITRSAAPRVHAPRLAGPPHQRVPERGQPVRQAGEGPSSRAVSRPETFAQRVGFHRYRCSAPPLSRPGTAEFKMHPSG